MMLAVPIGMLAQNETVVNNIKYSLNSATFEATVIQDNYSSLTSVLIPGTINVSGYSYDVVSIGENAFFNCNGLTDVTLCEGLKTIEKNAFAGCTGLTSLDLPSTLTTIGAFPFEYCTGLTSITIPASVTSIDKQAFAHCPNVTSMQVETGNPVYDSRNNCNAIIETANNILIEGCKGTTIPESVTTIGPCAFQGSGLTSINIPEGVTSIGYMAFCVCRSLTCVTLPSTLTDIESAAFMFDTNLTSIYCTSGNPQGINLYSDTFSDVYGATLYVPMGSKSAYEAATYWQNFSEIVETLLYEYDTTNHTATVIQSDYSSLTSVLIPGTVNFNGDSYDVVSIGVNAFSNCIRLTDVTLCEGLKTIEEDAFSGCTGLTSIIIPEGVTSIGLNAFIGSGLQTVSIPGTCTVGTFAFSNCPDLVEVVFCEGVTTCLSNTFRYCTSLKYVTLPTTMTSIGLNAFRGCTALERVVCKASTPPTTTGTQTFSAKGQADLFVPIGTVSAYQSADIWKDFKSISEMPTEVIIDGITYHLNDDGTATVIAGDYSSLTRVAIPAEVTTLSGTYSVTTIAAGAFADCYQLSPIALPESLTSIGDGAFANVPTWCQVYVHSEEPPTINSTVFPSGMIRLNVMSNPNLYQEAEGWQDFLDINQIGDFGSYRLVLHDDQTAEVSKGSSDPTVLNLTSNKVMVFDGYENIEYTLTGISEWGFIMCSTLTSVSLAPGMTTIGSGAFFHCGNISNVYLPESVTTIGEIAFSTCTSLTSLTLPKNVTSIGNGAFTNCPLTEIYSYATTPPVITGGWTFDCYDTATLYVPEGCVEAYQNATVWCNFTNIVEMAPVTPGDVDGDEEVDVADFTVLAKYLLGLPTEGFNPSAADVAGSTTGGPDGEIDVADLTGIANIILHSNNTLLGAPRRAAAVDTNIDAMDNAIYVEPVTAEPGTQQVISVRMKNNVEVSGLEFSLLLPEGITIATNADGLAMAEMSDKRTTMGKPDYFGSSLMSDGSMKILCASMTENRTTGRLYTFAGNDGEVARITVNIPADYEEGMYEVRILNAKVSDPDGVKTTLADTAAGIDVGYSQTTGIDSLTPNPSPTGEGGDYFTLDGKKLDKKPTQKGVYIVNGKKVVVK